MFESIVQNVASKYNDIIGYDIYKLSEDAIIVEEKRDIETSTYYLYNNRGRVMATLYTSNEYNATLEVNTTYMYEHEFITNVDTLVEKFYCKGIKYSSTVSTLEFTSVVQIMLSDIPTFEYGLTVYDSEYNVIVPRHASNATQDFENILLDQLEPLFTIEYR